MTRLLCFFLLAGCYRSHTLETDVDASAPDASEPAILSSAFTGEWSIDYCSGALRFERLTICEDGRLWLTAGGALEGVTVLREARMLDERTLLATAITGNSLGGMTLRLEGDELVWIERRDGESFWCQDVARRGLPPWAPDDLGEHSCD